jgi:hypothetical protein
VGLHGQRVAILASPLHELTGFYLAVVSGGTTNRREFAFLAAQKSKSADQMIWPAFRRLRSGRGAVLMVARKPKKISAQYFLFFNNREKLVISMAYKKVGAKRHKKVRVLG